MTIRIDSLAVQNASLTAQLYGRLPRSEVFARRYYGRSVDLANIEQAILMAQIGIMSPITDLSRETLRNDPAVSGMWFKRASSLSACDWDVQPATVGVDSKRAAQIADSCRQALARFRDFRQFLFDMAWGVFDGRAASEINWDLTSGPVRVWPTSHTWIHPGRLSFGPQRELRIVERHRQTSLYFHVGDPLNDYPAGKFVQWMPRNFGDYPEREGLCPRVLYWCFFKRFSWRHRMTLTELFGIPWRIIETDAGPDVPLPDGDALDDAEAAAENLGAETTLALEPGMKLRLESPHPESGTLFQMNTDEVNDELAKLILMQPKTSSGEANRAAGVIGERQEDVPKQRDGTGLEAVITEQMLRPFVAANYPAEDLIYCPGFHLRTEPERDRKADLERVDKVLSFGLAVTEAEVYETAGLRKPKDGEAVVRAPKNQQLDAQGKPIGPAGTLDPDGIGGMGGAIQSLLDAYDEDALAPPKDGQAEVDQGGVTATVSIPRVLVELAIAPEELGAEFGARLTVEELRRVPGLGTDEQRRLIERADVVYAAIAMVDGGHARPPFRGLRAADVAEREPRGRRSAGARARPRGAR
jgi:phage gp29-like protein